MQALHMQKLYSGKWIGGNLDSATFDYGYPNKMPEDLFNRQTVELHDIL